MLDATRFKSVNYMIQPKDAYRKTPTPKNCEVRNKGHAYKRKRAATRPFVLGEIS